jgi:hypothetical protein
MTKASHRELEERYASLSSDEFARLDRAKLTEEARVTYDQEAERRKTPQWRARETQREAQREQVDAQYAAGEQTRYLYGWSRNIIAITGLLMVGTAVLVILMFVAKKETLARLYGRPEMPFLLLLVALQTTAVVGLIRRTNWGRIMGIVVCCAALINIPLGTVIGIVGLYSFVKGKQLFGPHRLQHADLRREYKRLMQLAKKR